MEPQFRRMSQAQRLAYLQKNRDLTPQEVETLGGLLPPFELADQLIENALGYFPLPIGLAPGILIDGREYLIPMAVEESSIIASLSATANWLRRTGEMTTGSLGDTVIGQIQFPRVTQPEEFQAKIELHSATLIAQGNAMIPAMVNRGGGLQTIRTRRLVRPDGGTMIILHLHAHPCDAMGANLMNQLCEGLKPAIQQITGENVGLCILSNLTDTHLAFSTLSMQVEPGLGQAIVEAGPFRRAGSLPGCYPQQRYHERDRCSAHRYG